MDENNENPSVNTETQNSPDKWEIISFHRFWLEQNKSNPEELDYSKASQQLVKNLEYISDTSTNVDNLDKGPLGPWPHRPRLFVVWLSPQQGYSTTRWISVTVMREPTGNTIAVAGINKAMREPTGNTFMIKGLLWPRKRRKGSPVDKLWLAIETETSAATIEIKKMKLKRLQLCKHSQPCAKEDLEDVISNKRRHQNSIENREEMSGYETPTPLPKKLKNRKAPHVPFSTDTPHKPILLKQTAVSLSSTIVPGLKTLMGSLELKYPDVVKEIKYHLCEQAKLASLSEGLVKWLRTVLTSSLDTFDTAVNAPLNDACQHENKLRFIFRVVLSLTCKNDQTIERHASERKFLVEQVSIIFKYIEYVIGLMTFHWIEKHMMFTKALQFVYEPDKQTTTYKVDALAVAKITQREFATIEASGGPSMQDRQHTLEDTEKTLLEGAEMLQGTLQQYLDASVETAMKLKFYTMQIIVDRIVLVEISMYISCFKAVEVRSARWPFSWNFVGEYMHIFELIAYFKQLYEQEEVMKIIANEQRGVIEVHSATVRQWLE
ncbi:5960_t:CDS:10, partial [Ambispora leptoticha]